MVRVSFSGKRIYPVPQIGTHGNCKNNRNGRKYFVFSIIYSPLLCNCPTAQIIFHTLTEKYLFHKQITFCKNAIDDNWQKTDKKYRNNLYKAFSLSAGIFAVFLFIIGMRRQINKQQRNKSNDCPGQNTTAESLYGKGLGK